jgi:hypothetical protein
LTATRAAAAEGNPRRRMAREMIDYFPSFPIYSILLPSFSPIYYMLGIGRVMIFGNGFFCQQRGNDF